MGDGGTGYATRDFNLLMRGRAAAVPGTAGALAPSQSQSLLAGPAAPGAGGAAGDATGLYSLHGVYFNPQKFTSVADCLTAASAQQLPLEVCR
jgi:hypothetical protein